MSIQSLIHYGEACVHPPVQGQPALDMQGVTFRYPGDAATAVEGLDLRVMPGERVALVGPNGAGKSTLLKLAAGLIRAEAGEVSVYGVAAGSCHHRVALVPQRGEVDWRFPVTVREVVLMGRYAHLGWFKRPTKVDREAAAAAMEQMGISDLAHKQVGELSGGQQQRVMLARTLAQEADLLLLDEPLNHVDIRTQELIFHTLEALAQRACAVIVSTHDLGLLPIHFSRAVFVDRRVIADGDVREVLTPETIARAYGMVLCTDDQGRVSYQMAGK